MILFDCYSIIKGNCNGSCQGCGCCPYCDEFHGNWKEGKAITRWVMFKYWLGLLWFEVYGRRKMKKVCDEYFNSPEGKASLQKIVDKIKTKSGRL